MVTLIFTSLVTLISWAGSLGQSWQNVGFLISQGLLPVIHVLVPIIGLILGYNAIVGEIETGSLLLLASHSVSRLEILIGKIIGRGFILIYSIVIGFGLGGIAIAFNVRDADFGAYAIYIGTTILLGFLFYCMGVMISTFFRRRSLAIGISLSVWTLFVFIWPIITTILIFTQFSSFSFTADDLSYSIPSWFYAVDLFNPITVYDRLVTLAVTSLAEFNGSLIPMPSFYTSGLMIGLLGIWIVALLCIGWFRFQHIDI